MGKVDERFEAIEKEIGEMSESLQRLPRLEQAIEGHRENMTQTLLSLHEVTAHKKELYH